MLHSTEKTKIIRKALKEELGYTNRKVRVRAKRTSTRTTIVLTINSKEAEPKKVMELAKKHDRSWGMSTTHVRVETEDSIYTGQLDENDIKALTEAYRTAIEQNVNAEFAEFLIRPKPKLGPSHVEISYKYHKHDDVYGVSNVLAFSLEDAAIHVDRLRHIHDLLPFVD